MEDEVLAKTSRRETEGQEELLSDKVSIQEEKMDGLLLSETIWEKMNHLFPTFRDWILVEEIQLTRLPYSNCRLCHEYVSVSPYYAAKEEGSGEESRPVVHKVCGDLPMEMEHHLLHPGHTLRKTISEDTQWYCYYKCSHCEEFSLDIKCALKLFPINHICHPQHPLVPNHESDQEFYCDACSMVHNHGISYECSTCPSFRVHQYCVSPRIVKLPSHRHDVKFVYSLPETQFGQPIYCHICRQHLKGQSLAYHCARCRYYFHIFDCRSIQHSSSLWDGPLVLVEEEGADAESESAKCLGCLLKISVPFYVSTHRRSDVLHKFCAELPDRVQHRLHPGHQLTLSVNSLGKQVCDACHKPWKGFSYTCPRGSCRFSIDIICGLKNVHSHHKFHKHLLIASYAKGLFACSACNIDSDGPSYKCTTCRFWVHYQCASTPMSRKHEMHPHLLKLTYSIQDSAPDDHRTFYCQVCREEMQPDDWAYHCSGCKYYIHIHDCYLPWSRETEEFDYEAALAAAVRLPPVDSKSVSLATMFFMDTYKGDNSGLKQDADGIKAGQPLFLDPDETCHRCADLLAAPCRNCHLCNYFLPKSPVELDDHDSLIRGYYSMLKASPNQTNCNGFGISFRDQGLLMKISSSVLPRYINHEGHQHVLLTTFITKPTWCSACEGHVLRGYAFRCNVCNFTIDTYCALLPGFVKHRYDKKHPFKLTYYSIEGVEEYVCELCEKDITTMWFYHCAECDHSIHPRCIWRYFIYFGPHIVSDYTDALLAPTTKTHPSKCDECDRTETTGCRYSVFPSTYGCRMTHLECRSGMIERWPQEQTELGLRLDWLLKEEEKQVL